VKFLVVGDKMVDKYYLGKIVRLNPERHSAPLLSCTSGVAIFLGGAANVAENLRTMGAQVESVHQKFGSIIKSRLYSLEDGVIARFDEELSECVPATSEDVASAAKDCCAVLVSDYGKGTIDQSVADQIKALDLPTFADVKVRPDRWASWCEAMFPNEREYFAHVNDYRDSRLCVIKRGDRGARLYQGGLTTCQVPSKARCVKNVAGAGDTVMAAFAASYMAIGLSLDPARRRAAALDIAMDFAARAVELPFTSAPSFDVVYGDKISGVAEFVKKELAK
jgi:bifunctional ADP-heptose synthase (sugar kinase/adenylyltransferase)